jgi:hypothetical protein
MKYHNLISTIYLWWKFPYHEKSPFQHQKSVLRWRQRRPVRWMQRCMVPCWGSRALEKRHVLCMERWEKSVAIPMFLGGCEKTIVFKDSDVSWWFSILWLLLPLRILNDDWFVWMISLRRFMDFSWRWLAFMGKARIRLSISELHIQIYHIQFVPPWATGCQGATNWVIQPAVCSLMFYFELSWLILLVLYFFPG